MPIIGDMPRVSRFVQPGVVMRTCPCVQASNEETKEHLYESLMAECRDTIQAVREELKSEAVRAQAAASWLMENSHLPSFCSEAAREEL